MPIKEVEKWSGLQRTSSGRYPCLRQFRKVSIGFAKIGLLHCQHEDSHHEDKDAGIHILVDHITYHLSVLYCALTGSFFVGATLQQHDSEGQAHDPGEQHSEIFHRDTDNTGLIRGDKCRSVIDFFILGIF
jgi:hypothetical protein